MNRKILIASTTKPVDDTRMTDKIAAPLAEVHKYTIYVVGFPSKFKPVYSNINFFEIPKAGYNIKNRLKALLYVLRILIKVKPEICIATNTETLIVMRVYQIIFGSYLVYDIRENYSLNYDSRKSKNLNKPSKKSSLISKVERTLIQQANAYISAEPVYFDQLNINNSSPKLFYENKAILPLDKSVATNTVDKFLISGTLSNLHGTIDAIRWYKSASQQFNEPSLTIIGQCHNHAYIKALLKECAENPTINVFISRTPIPHRLLSIELKKCKYVLSPYLNTSAFKGKLPTKLFEAAANGKIIISRSNASWNHFFKATNLIEIGFNPDNQDDISKIKFYKPQSYNTVFFEADKTSLIEFFNNLD
ncbi:glycosyltransferase family protein [Marinigracilibium pacificum]|uniref:Glycosyltransferase family 4 protein n=1 Tax=Marinigracilibium pacificum TaxID=2729599 RepID=A0A848J3Y0_9BACT|nr:hypothetical protein [Marinigracilibium pacificum]NMM50028.1 glycosyltransferase family 4 protein [Marinigracilibium pacificum]